MTDTRFEPAFFGFQNVFMNDGLIFFVLGKNNMWKCYLFELLPRTNNIKNMQRRVSNLQSLA